MPKCSKIIPEWRFNISDDNLVSAKCMNVTERAHIIKIVTGTPVTRLAHAS